MTSQITWIYTYVWISYKMPVLRQSIARRSEIIVAIRKEICSFIPSSMVAPRPMVATI